LQAYDQAASAQATTLVRQDALDKKGIVKTDPTDCGLSATHCRLVLVYKPGEAGAADPGPFANGTPLTVDSLIPSHVAAAQEIAEYASALTELTAADSTKAVSEALGKIATTINSLAETVRPGSGPAVGALTGPSASLFSWVFGKYQESLKLDALRKATSAMDPVIQDAAHKFNNVAMLSQAVNQDIRAEAVRAAKNAYLDHQDESHLLAYIKATRDMDAALSVPPSDVFRNLAEVHHQMTLAVHDQLQTPADIQKALSRLSSDAEALFKIAQSFQAAAQTAAAKP
jgi:hypothetical protein